MAKQTRQIVQGGGHYLLVVKRNQRTLYDAITAACDELPFCNRSEKGLWHFALTSSQGSGQDRQGCSTLESTMMLNDDVAFSGVVEVLRRTRTTQFKSKT